MNTQTSQSTQTFTCNFGNGVSCRAVIDMSQFQPGATRHLAIEWTGRPTPSVLKPYREWMLGVQQAVSNLSAQKIAYAFLLSGGKTEIWIFEPGGQPRRA